MRGMLNFLEKAGLVRNDDPEVDAPPEPANLGIATLPTAAVHAPIASLGAPLDLEAIYASGGVTPAIYPAERLLRLLDGLSAMDEGTRLIAVKAMDAADESWSIEDPLADASAKLHALNAHAQRLQANLQALEAETQSRLNATASRRDQVVGDIRKQISELEALAARELSRADSDAAAQQADLKSAQEQTVRELAEIAQLSQRLQGLAGQFGAGAAPTKE